MAGGVADSVAGSVADGVVVMVSRYGSPLTPRTVGAVYILLGMADQWWWAILLCKCTGRADAFLHPRQQHVTRLQRCVVRQQQLRAPGLQSLFMG